MGDEERERVRKGKQPADMDEMDDGAKRARMSSANMGDQLLGNRDSRGENAPPSAPVGNQPHGYHPMGQQSGVAPRFGSNPRQFVLQQQQLEQQEQRGPSAPQQIQIPGSNPPQYYFAAAGQHTATTAAAQQQQLRYMAELARPMFLPFSTADAQQQQQQRLHQVMAELAEVAGIPPQAYEMPRAYETFSTTGAQQQLRADMPPVGAAQRVVLPDLNLPPPQEHPAVPVGYNPAITRAAASNAREDGINPGQNAAPPCPLYIQTHPTRWQPGGVVLGGSTWLRPPSMARCPLCRSCAMYNNTICMVCAVGEAVRISNAGPIPEDWKCSVCRQYPGGMVDVPWRHVCRCVVCHFVRGAVCPICISAPQPRHQQNLGLVQANPAQNAPGSAFAAVVNQPHGLPTGHQPGAVMLEGSTSRPGLQEQAGAPGSEPLQRQQQPAGLLESPSPEYVAFMEKLAAEIYSVGESSGAAGRQPTPHVDMPVGSHYDPVVPGSGPALGNSWCSACRLHPARKVLQPWEHDCLCFTCLHVDPMMCPVCSSG